MASPEAVEKPQIKLERSSAEFADISDEMNQIGAWNVQERRLYLRFLEVNKKTAFHKR
jgi:hypothetical protein